MATKRELSDLDTILSDIESKLKADTNDAQIWLRTLQIYEEENPGFDIKELIKTLVSEKHKDGKAFFLVWETPINELPLTVFFPRVVFDPDFYNTDAYLTNISRSLQKFFFPHIIVEAVTDHSKKRLCIKFKVNTDKKRKFIPNKDSMPEFLFVTNFPDNDVMLNTWLDKWASTTQVLENIYLVPRTVEFFRENLACAVFAVRDGKLLGAAGLVYNKNADGNHIYFEGRKVVELISDVEFETQKYYTAIFIEMRLSFVHNMDLFPIVVTMDRRMLPLLKKYFSPVENIPRLMPLKLLVKDCNCTETNKPSCSTCPLAYKNLLALIELLG